jgi:hypothetical protein
VVGLVRRDALARFAGVTGLLTILFMVHTPVTYVVDHVLPGFGNFKPLSRAAFMLQFALAVLAAYGLQTVLDRMSTPTGRRLSGSPLVAGGLLGVLIDRLFVNFGGAGLEFGVGLVLAVTTVVLCALGVELASRRVGFHLAAARLGPRLPMRGAAAGLVLVIAVAASIVGQEWSWKKSVMLHQPNGAAYLYPPTHLIGSLELHPGARFVRAGSTFQGSTAMIYPLQSAAGYESLLPARIQNFWRVVAGGEAPQELASHPLIYAYDPQFDLAKLRPGLLARAGVATVVALPADVDHSLVPAGLALRYGGSDGRLFAVAKALPRAYMVGGCEQVASPLDALKRFVADDFAPTRTVLLETHFLEHSEGSCSGSPGSAGTASVLKRSPNSLVVYARATRPGWLVVNDSWDSGWSATVDGRASDALAANYAFRAVRLSPGEHTVRFSYEPPSFRVGAALSALTLGVVLGGLGVVLVLPRWRARRG